MRDARQQIEELKSAVRALEAKVRVTNKRLAGVMTTPPFQTVLVVADEKIEPDETGKCFIMKRLSRDTYNNGFRKLDKRESTSFQVYNHRKTPIFEGEEFHIARDTTGDYYRVRDREHYFAWFKTPAGGIEGHWQDDPTHPGVQPYCERWYWDADTGILKVLEDPETGDPVVEPVYNFTPSRVDAGKFIMAKRFGPDWFIDVEPC